MLRVAIGNLIEWGVVKGKNDIPSPTVHLLVGTCPHRCTYCGMHHEYSDGSVIIGRVRWVPWNASIIREGITKPSTKRVCVHVCGAPPSHLEKTIATCSKPVSLCVRSVKDIPPALLNAPSVDRLCITLDAATPDVGKKVGRNNGENVIDELIRYAHDTRWRGKVLTHIICGLGETEKDMVETLRTLLREGISVALFSFYPSGECAQDPPVHLGQYRRVQVAYGLLRENISQEFTYDAWGAILYEDVHLTRVKPSYFETTGCPHCNRPYYDHTPRSITNFARPLTREEYKRAVSELSRYQRKVEIKEQKLLKVTYEYDRRDNTLTKVQLAGDFFAHPEDIITNIEESLVGVHRDTHQVMEKIHSIIEKFHATLIGITPETIARALCEEERR